MKHCQKKSPGTKAKKTVVEAVKTKEGPQENGESPKKRVKSPGILTYSFILNFQ